MESMGKKPRRRRAFTTEFRAEIAELCQRGDRSVGQVAKDFDLTETAARMDQAGRTGRRGRGRRAGQRRAPRVRGKLRRSRPSPGFHSCCCAAPEDRHPRPSDFVECARLRSCFTVSLEGSEAGPCDADLAA
jgi:transposase-like protein